MSVPMHSSISSIYSEKLNKTCVHLFITSWLPGVTRVFIIPIFYQTNTHTSIYIYISVYIYNIYAIYKMIFLYMYEYIFICVPSLVEIAPGVPDFCWNIHTYIHFCFIYIYIRFLAIHIVICVPSLVEIVPELCWNIHTHTHPFIYIYIYIYRYRYRYRYRVRFSYICRTKSPFTFCTKLRNS
jgi:hypothetical protein